jgi:hypothetical protein
MAVEMGAVLLALFCGVSGATRAQAGLTRRSAKIGHVIILGVAINCNRNRMTWTAVWAQSQITLLMCVRGNTGGLTCLGSVITLLMCV